MKHRSAGFTLIELLVTVAIIGVLAAIAFPFYAGYRQRAFDARALNDCWDAINAEEAYYLTNHTYIPIGPLGPFDTPHHIDTPGFTLAPTVALTVTVTGDQFTVSAYSNRGMTRYDYDNVTSVITESPL